MFVRTLKFSELVTQGRWKVEFFASDSGQPRATAFPLVPLGELLTERRESLDPQAYPDHLFNYLGLEHVQGVVGDVTLGYVPRLGREVLSRSKVFRRGDILYGRLRPSLNKVFVADEVIPEGICSGEFYVLTPDRDRLLPAFGRELLASSYVQSIVRSMTTGSALPRLQLEDLLEAEVPLPSVELQEQYLDELRERVKRRRAMAFELSEGPTRQLDDFVAWLESGDAPVFQVSSVSPVLSFAMCLLPETVDTEQKRRGRLPRQASFQDP